MKKSILFVVDKPNWAFEFMVNTWIPLIANDYDTYIAYAEDYWIVPSNNKSSVYRTLFNTAKSAQFALYKLIGADKKVSFISSDNNYFYSKYTNPKIYQVSANLQKEQSSKSDFDIMVQMDYFFQYRAEIPAKAAKNTIGIFTDSYPHDGPNIDLKNNVDVSQLTREQFYQKYLEKYDWLMVGGGNLLKDYLPITDRVSFVYGIYGQDEFIENTHVGQNPTLNIGWTGNPNRSMKGYQEVILPAIDELQKEGYKINLKTKFSGPYHELFSFYQDVDLLLIASNADSGPSSFAEASLSKVPTISTKVGLPLMIIEDGKNGIFIDRTKNSLKEAIKKLYNDRGLLKEFSDNIKTDYLRIMDNRTTVTYFLKTIQ